jgi:hypothetical protein
MLPSSSLYSLNAFFGRDEKRLIRVRHDQYETSNAVLGVKQSLVVDLKPANVKTAQKYNVAPGTKMLQYDFVLVSNAETESLRDAYAVAARGEMGKKMKLADHLPVPELD